MILGWNPHPKPASYPFFGYWWHLKSTHGVKHLALFTWITVLGSRSTSHNHALLPLPNDDDGDDDDDDDDDDEDHDHDHDHGDGDGDDDEVT